MTIEQLNERAKEVVDGLAQMGSRDVAFVLVADGCVVTAGSEDQAELIELLHDCANDWLFTDPLDESTPERATGNGPW